MEAIADLDRRPPRLKRTREQVDVRKSFIETTEDREDKRKLNSGYRKGRIDH
jgi:hypothetical protein